MAASNCPKCSSESFELVGIVPDGSKFRLLAVQCSSCGSVVGVMDARNIGAMLMEQQAAIKMIASASGVSVDFSP